MDYYWGYGKHDARIYGYSNNLYLISDSTIIIDSIAYKKIFSNKRLNSISNIVNSPYPQTTQSLDTAIEDYAYMRMDSNHIIYCKMIKTNAYYLYWDTSEFVFMRPDLQIGDTLTYPLINKTENLVVNARYYDTFTNLLTQQLDSALTYKFDVIDGNIEALFSYVYGYLQSGPLYSEHFRFETPMPEIICFADGVYQNNNQYIFNPSSCENSGALIPKNLNIASVYGENTLIVYPNPVISSFKIITTNQAINTNWKLVIYNSLGQLVKNELYNIGNEVNVENLSTGLYMLQLIDDGQLFYISKFKKR
jgi:hypothetical protein